MGLNTNITVAHDPVNHGFTTLHFKRPQGFDFKPGQYIEIYPSGAGNSEQKDWSKIDVFAIASGCRDGEIQVSANKLKSWNPLCAIEDESTHVSYENLDIRGPIGSSYPLESIESSEKVLLIGGGAGLTPLHSVMESLSNEQKKKCKYYYSATTQDNIPYFDEMKKYSQSREGHVVSLTREEVEGFEHGRITEKLKESPLKPEATMAFICGPEPFVLETIKVLLEKGMDRKNIFSSLNVSPKIGGPVLRADHEYMEKLALKHNVKIDP